MQLGVCTSPEKAATVQAAGFNFVEASTQALLQGLLPDDQWTGLAQAKASPLPIPSANVLVPGSLKITGPDADLGRLRAYLATVMARAEQVGIRTLVFGSGGARNVPDGFPREQARDQIVAFARAAAELAAPHGVTVVIEPLNRKECNVINSVAEAMDYVRAADHPNLRCLVDSYHFWLEDEPLENLRQAMPWIRHVHVADKEGRVAPGESGQSDYRPFFRVLRDADYDGLIAIEGNFPDVAGRGPAVREYVFKQWNEC